MGVKLRFPGSLDVPHDSRVQMQASGPLRAAELRAQAAERQSGPPPPRKKRLCAMRCSTLPGRRLYERLPGWRLELLATHWPPTPRSRARADATTIPATYRRRRLSRSGARGRPRTTSSRCGGRSRGQGLQLAAHKPGRLGVQSPGTSCCYQAEGRATSRQPASCEALFACERVSACILGAQRVIKSYMVEERAQRPVCCSILQYAAVYCSILRCFWIFFLFFGHWGVAGLADKKDENGSMHMCWITMTGAGAHRLLLLLILLLLLRRRLLGRGSAGARWRCYSSALLAAGHCSCGRHPASTLQQTSCFLLRLQAKRRYAG